MEQAHNTPLKERFLRRVEKTDTCWIWRGTILPKGYGNFTTWSGGKSVGNSAHRLSWRLFVGPIPEGMCVLHKCDNPPCVNPSHLFIGTRSDNSIDMVKKGRHPSQVHPERLRRGNDHWTRHRRSEFVGELNWNARFSDKIIRKIRSEYAGMRGDQARIARKYDISKSHARGIVLREIWAHI